LPDIQKKTSGTCLTSKRKHEELTWDVLTRVHVTCDGDPAPASTRASNNRRIFEMYRYWRAGSVHFGSCDVDPTALIAYPTNA
jgi:hypothetical protein